MCFCNLLCGHSKIVSILQTIPCSRLQPPPFFFLLDPRMLVIDIGPTGRTRCFHMLYNMITVMKIKKKKK